MKRLSLILLVAVVTCACYAQRIKVHQGNNINSFHVSLLDSITFHKNEMLKFFCKNQVSEFFVNNVDSITINDGLCPDDNHPHAIDLGLPSGTKWCCCNVGASTPEGYGGYYAWGETSEKTTYDWYTYKWCNGSYDTMTKYCTDTYLGYNGFTDGKTELELNDDVARVRMGAPWRMPSHDQQMELYNNCSRQWTQLNGVNGILVTGPSGGQIFLPAAGYRWIVELGAGSFGDYWSSSLFPSKDYDAYRLYFNSGGWRCDSSSRDGGHSVRAVRP